MLPFIRTLFDIALLRKGPDSVPRSGILLLMSLLLWALAIAAYVSVFEAGTQMSLQRIFFGLAFGTACFYGVLSVARRTERALQTITALIGCGALLVSFFIAAMVTIGQVVGNLAQGMLFLAYMIWSMSVEGHIIARAIDRALYVGVIIAFAIFIVQFGVLEMVFPRATDG